MILFFLINRRRKISKNVHQFNYTPLSKMFRQIWRLLDSLHFTPSEITSLVAGISLDTTSLEQSVTSVVCFCYNFHLCFLNMASTRSTTWRLSTCCLNISRVSSVHLPTSQPISPGSTFYFHLLAWFPRHGHENYFGMMTVTDGSLWFDVLNLYGGMLGTHQLVVRVVLKPARSDSFES